jgi:hypothetical protein
LRSYRACMWGGIAHTYQMPFPGSLSFIQWLTSLFVRLSSLSGLSVLEAWEYLWIAAIFLNQVAYG